MSRCSAPHVMELALRQGVSQPLDLEQCHGQVRCTVRLLTIPDSDLRDLVQTAFGARVADFAVFDRQLAQARPSEHRSAGGSAAPLTRELACANFRHREGDVAVFDHRHYPSAAWPTCDVRCAADSSAKFFCRDS